MIDEVTTDELTAHVTRLRGALPVGVPLSAKQLQIIHLRARGLTNKEIAGELRVSDQTIKNHISMVLVKLAVTTTEEAFTALGWLSPPDQPVAVARPHRRRQLVGDPFADTRKIISLTARIAYYTACLQDALEELAR